MATTAFKSTPVNTVDELPAVGSAAPAFELTGSDLSPVTLESLAGRTVVLNIFPSIDTGICATSVRTFNQAAADLENTTVVAVSADLPFAAGRFCSAEGIDQVVTGSVFRSTFGEDYGVTQAEGPMAGLLARAVIVVDPQGTVKYTELVPEITTEPDYEAALAAVRA
jgi:thioredoxin-dependent peroxiredoxin